MTRSMTDEQFEREVRAVLAVEAEDVAAAPTAAEMVIRIRSAAPRSAPLRRGSWWPGAIPTDRRFVVAVAALLLVALVGSLVVVGNLLDQEAPVVVTPTQSATPTHRSPEPPSTPRVDPEPTVWPPTMTSGSAETELGRLAWTRLAGNRDTLPFGDVFATPRGYAAVDPNFDGRGSRFWESPDGLAWTVRPLPVPAAGPVGHGMSDGMHWLWSIEEFRLWRSSDFETWQEVDVRALAPAPVPGLRWRMEPMGPTTIGSTTLLPWHVRGEVMLSELLGIAVEPGERLRIFDEPPWGVGDDRAVYLTRGPELGPPGGRVKVGSIRVTLNGTIVTVTDAERDVALLEIDAAAAGFEADSLARTLNQIGFTPTLPGGAVIADGIVRPMAYPSAPAVEFVDLVAIDGSFVGWTEHPTLRDGATHVWSTADGFDWTDLGAASFPVSDATGGAFSAALRRTDGEPGRPLIAAVMVNEGDEQRDELWSSADGRTWSTVGLVYTYPERGLYPFYAPSASGGYLATGDDYHLWVSASGADWTVVEGLTGIGTIFESTGGGTRVEVTREAAFILEETTGLTRLVWVFRIQD